MHHPHSTHGIHRIRLRLTLCGLTWLLLTAAPAAMAADHSPELYEAAFCKSVGGKAPGADAFWQQRFKKLSRQATPSAVESAQTRAMDDNLDFSVKDIERQKSLCDSKMAIAQRVDAASESLEKDIKHRNKFYEEQDKVMQKLTERVNASSAEKARCLVVMHVMQHHVHKHPEILAPASEPERQKQELAGVDKLVLLWQADFEGHMGPSNKVKAQQFYAAEDARYGREWLEQKQRGTPQLVKFMVDNAGMCRDKMREIVKKAKQR